MDAKLIASLNTKGRLPPDVYATQVEALYQDVRSLKVGILAAFLTTAGTGLVTADLLIDSIAAALAFVGLVRLFYMRRFWACRPGLNEAALQRWEQGYVLGGSLHLLLLGCFCLAAFTRTADPFAWLASLSITMAYLIGTPGRSFASSLLVDAQILVSALPLTMALAAAGSRYWIIILCVILPFFLALKTISARLRGIFQDAVLRARDISILAKRFDTALSNMPHGLAMFTTDGRISVANARFRTLLGETCSLEDQAIGDVLQAYAARSNDIGPSHGLWIGSEGQVSPAVVERWVSTRADGCSISFTIQGMADGGGVIIAEDVTEQTRAQASLAFLARHDKLTGLPNRHGFQEALARRLREAPAAGMLMFVDLDRFKSVNDTLGHAIGDRLLHAVAMRLEQFASPDTLLARFGGDEFVIYGASTHLREHASKLAERIIVQMSEPYDIGGHRIVIGATIGIAEASGCSDAEALLREADLALYSAKSNQKGTFCFFENEMQASAVARRDLEDDLRDAIALEQLQLHFQPIVRAADGRITSCEALLRWKHPIRGFVPPSEFIGIAEETGAIWELGSWVLKQACLECARWPENISVAVNVSALQFGRGDLAEVALRATIEAGLSPRRLEIEVTESSLLQNLNDARVQILRLRHFGFRVSLDDFGTGYSSLSYLQRLPFDKLKLDRSFLMDPEWGGRGAKVLQGIARLGSDLGMLVVMEGIETSQHLELVRHLHIPEMQGFLLKRPIPAMDIRELLDRGIDLRPDGGAHTRAIA